MRRCATCRYCVDWMAATPPHCRQGPPAGNAWSVVRPTEWCYSHRYSFRRLIKYLIGGTNTEETNG